MARPPTRPSSLPVQVSDTLSAMASGPPAPSWVLDELELGLPRKNMEAGYSRNGMYNCRPCNGAQVTNQSSAHAKSRLKKASRHLYGVRRHPAAGIPRLCARSSPNRQARRCQLEPTRTRRHGPFTLPSDRHIQRPCRLATIVSPWKLAKHTTRERIWICHSQLCRSASQFWSLQL
jgi:hypothetical protein